MTTDDQMEFKADDLDTPTEADLEQCYGSKYLGAADIGDKKIRAKILKIRKEVLQQQGGAQRPKFVIYFANLEKPMVLNSTNTAVLVNALGRPPANWVGVECGIFCQPTQYQGRPTMGLRLRVLSPPAKKPGPTKLAAKPAAADEPPPSDPDDPGAFPDDRGFEEAAE